ncbi:hypothetical protein PLUTE_a4582 [Pseudoalteromonas luteoviolacea DSM 6061]|nr:hypothetical protein [Pseudoalteromonas luteoviolacea DSM 6061]
MKLHKVSVAAKEKSKYKAQSTVIVRLAHVVLIAPTFKRIA